MRSLRGLTVVDLSSLWAGPLCGRLLADRGARVIKVESTARPDGARRGPSSIYDALNAGKESVSIDLRTQTGMAVLRALIEPDPAPRIASGDWARDYAAIKLADPDGRVVQAMARTWLAGAGH